MHVNTVHYYFITYTVDIDIPSPRMITIKFNNLVFAKKNSIIY